MSKRYVLNGVDGNIGAGAAEFALSIRQPDQKLVFTTFSLQRIPADKLAAWRAADVDVLEANYEDVDSMTKAFRDAEAVAWVSTWAIGHRPQQSANVLEACRAAGVKRVLYTSFVGAGLGVDTDEGLARDIATLPYLPQDHAATERLIRASGLTWNTQRNYLYQDNTVNIFTRAWKYCGNRWLNNSGGRRGAYVAREDCARVFGALLLGRGEPNRVYYVSGPEAVTDREMMDYILSKTGYKAELVAVEDEELRKYWADRGMTTDALEMLKTDVTGLPMPICQGDLVCCGQLVRLGYMEKVHDTVEKLTGRKPLTYQENYVKYEALFPRND